MDSLLKNLYIVNHFSGGIADLYDNTDTMSLYMLSAPETARMIIEFEIILNAAASSSIAHHEEAPKLQNKFLTDVRNLIAAVEEKGNPFMDKGDTLKRLDTREVMEPEVIRCYRSMKSIGKAQHEAFIQNRLVDCTTPLTDVIPRNSFYTFDKRLEPKGKKPDLYKSLKQSFLLMHQLFLAIRS